MGRKNIGRTERWTIRLKPEIDELLEKVSRERGLNKTDLVESIIIEWAYTHGYNKIIHFNFRNSSITVWDDLLNETVELLYDISKKTLFCSRCRTVSCGHIYAAAKIPEVKQKLKRGQIVIDEV
ncbi:MAG: hypothetical protein NZ929_06525 [Aigarchaeota archaeon]|nr:hypothetical protein [Aigarchaeota archaeon]MCX8192407.1 hypothetical protein [Nitrososphaeria archaeon]MDW7986613.1 hypothetical protein [Nitrososphaerota archaeon]